MRYRPCLHCPIRKTCDILELLRLMMNAGKSDARRVLVHFSLLDFKCDTRQNLFSPGDRVSTKLRPWIEHKVHHSDGPEWEDEEGAPEDHEGTVMFWKRNKVMVWLDEPIKFLGQESIRVKLWPDRLEKLDEPSVPVCSSCGRPGDKENEENWWCDECSSQQER